MISDIFPIIRLITTAPTKKLNAYMAFSLADVADSLGYVLGPPLSSALCSALGKTPGLAVFGLGVAAIVPAVARLPK